MRVLWITNMFYEDGAATSRGIFVRQQWDALLATGRVDLEREVVAQGRSSRDYLAANARVRERWDQGRFDLVHVHYGLTGLATLMLPSSARRLFTFYGSDINQRVQRTISVATARRAVKRLYVSSRLAEVWPDERNVVLPNGVDFEACAPRDRAEARRALGLAEAGPVILFGAHPDNPVKGWDVFQAVLERLRSRGMPAEPLVLTEAGQGYDRVVTKLNAADVLLFTSRRGTEGSPTVVKEALAVGLPVVSTDVGDAAQMLDGVSPGRVVPWPADGADAEWVDSLAAAAEEVLKSGQRSDGRELRGFLRQETIVERLLDIYREAATARI